MKEERKLESNTNNNQHYDIIFVGFAVNPEAAGKDNKYYNF